jgi:hypothetical protein
MSEREAFHRLAVGVAVVSAMAAAMWPVDAQSRPPAFSPYPSTEAIYRPTLALVAAVVASPVFVPAQAAMNAAGVEVGSDPDTAIRFGLNRDHQWKTGG